MIFEIFGIIGIMASIVAVVGLILGIGACAAESVAIRNGGFIHNGMWYSVRAEPRTPKVPEE